LLYCHCAFSCIASKTLERNIVVEVVARWRSLAPLRARRALLALILRRRAARELERLDAGREVEARAAVVLLEGADVHVAADDEKLLALREVLGELLGTITPEREVGPLRWALAVVAF